MVGGNLLLLDAIERVQPWTSWLGRALETLGQAPLAFYIAHLWLFARRRRMVQAGRGLRHGVRGLAGRAGAALLRHVGVRTIHRAPTGRLGVEVLLTSGVMLTFDDFAQFPDDGNRHELIDGEHVVTASPNLKPQAVAGNLHGLPWT